MLQTIKKIKENIKSLKDDIADKSTPKEELAILKNGLEYWESELEIIGDWS